ncbi:substrate-binding domain-containing protein [Morganella morganii]|uniref:substrate-binding domain-containing protein n=1 Tax=Morganella morganii TaxID=582 RepID=UPI0034D67940
MHIMAAGSLRGALTAILARYSGNKIPPVTCDFGPAGLLRQKIESGVKCDLFLSADRAHPEALLRNKTAFRVEPFIANYLGITTTTELAEQYPDWQQLLCAPDLIIGTSTPVDDPCGDYVVQFYSELSKVDPELAENIRNRTRYLVGGKKFPGDPGGANGVSVVDSLSSGRYIYWLPALSEKNVTTSRARDNRYSGSR